MNGPRAAQLQRVRLGVRSSDNWVQLLRFGVVGGSGYVVNLAVFALLATGTDMHQATAAVWAFCVAVTNNFVLNRIWTFREQGARSEHAGFQAARFFAVSLVGLGVNLAILALLVEAGMPELAAQAVAVAAATPVNFAGNKLWTFAGRRDERRGRRAEAGKRGFTDTAEQPAI